MGSAIDSCNCVKDKQFNNGNEISKKAHGGRPNAVRKQAQSSANTVTNTASKAQKAPAAMVKKKQGQAQN